MNHCRGRGAIKWYLTLCWCVSREKINLAHAASLTSQYILMKLSRRCMGCTGTEQDVADVDFSLVFQANERVIQH